jgi:hypothetical protein
MINYVSFNISKNSSQGTPDVSAITRPALGLSYQEIFPANRSNVAPQVNIAGFSGYNSGDRIKNGNGTLQFRDDFTKVLGAHTLEFGAQITRARKNENTNVRDEGVVTFNTSAVLSSKNAVADVLLGNFQNYTETQNDSVWWARFSQYEFAQDSWKMSSAHRQQACGTTSFRPSIMHRKLLHLASAAVQSCQRGPGSGGQRFHHAELGRSLQWHRHLWQRLSVRGQRPSAAI